MRHDVALSVELCHFEIQYHFTTILRLKISIHTVFGLDKLVFIIALFNVCFYSVNN